MISFKSRYYDVLNNTREPFSNSRGCNGNVDFTIANLTIVPKSQCELDDHYSLHCSLTLSTLHIYNNVRPVNVDEHKSTFTVVHKNPTCIMILCVYS